MQYRKIPFVSLKGYEAQFPNGGYLGGLPVEKVLVFRPQKNASPGWRGFFAWVAATHPKLYDYARVSFPDYVGDIEGTRSGAAHLAGLGADPTSPIPSVPDYNAESRGAPQYNQSVIGQLVTGLAQAAQTIIPSLNAQKIFNVQMDRARQGLPPLNTTTYGTTTGAPMFASSGGLFSNPMVWVAGAGVVALVFLTRGRSRGRR
jgi:hypothetical protein